MKDPSRPQVLSERWVSYPTVGRCALCERKLRGLNRALQRIVHLPGQGPADTGKRVFMLCEECADA